MVLSDSKWYKRLVSIFDKSFYLSGRNFFDFVEYSLFVNICVRCDRMSEKEKIAKQMKEIVEQLMSEPQLKAHMLMAIEQHVKESDLLFGRLAYLHYDLFSTQGDHSTYIAAAIELIVLAGDLLDDLVDQDRLEDTAILSGSCCLVSKRLQMYRFLVIKN